MKTFDNLTVRVSWTLVLAIFSLLVLGVGALGLYANHYGRQAFGTLNQINVEQTAALNRAYIDVLRSQVAMDRAAELIRVPSFDAPAAGATVTGRRGWVSRLSWRARTAAPRATRGRSAAPPP